MSDGKISRLNSCIIFVFLCVLLISCLSTGFAADFKIGVLARQGDETCMEKWKPTAEYLSDKIPGEKFEIIPLDFNSMVPFVKKGNCDFVLTNPAFYVELEKKYGINRIATLKTICHGRGETKFGGVVFCRADEKNIKNFNDLKDKIYAAPDPRSFGGWIAVLREFKNKGIDPFHEFKNIKFTRTMDSVVYAVKNNEADAGSVRTGTLESMAMEGKIDIKNFHIINSKKHTGDFPFVRSTELYPEWPMAAVKHIDPKLAGQVADALINMPEDSAAARAAECTGWAIPSNYQVVHECLKELNLCPYSKSGDITFKDVLKHYRLFFSVIFALIIFLSGVLVVYLFLNQKIKTSNAELAQEIKERKGVENNLRESRNRLRESEALLKNVFQASPLGITLLKDRKIIWYNDNLPRMTGFSLDEIRGKNARILYKSDEEFQRVGRVIKRVCQEGKISEIETRWVKKDGSEMDCHIRYALLDPEKKDSTVLAIVEDITERNKEALEKEKLRNQLNQAQKMESIGILAGGVAHDFNNILTTIMGTADLIMMDLNKDEDLYQHINEIRKAGERAAALTRQLLAFSRKEIIKPVVMNLNFTLTNIEKMLRRLIGEDIDLAVECDPELLHIKADPGQVEQIIMNLAVNAKDAMPSGGKLTIETVNVHLDRQYFIDHAVEEDSGQFVMMAVTDNGIGMDRETQSRIFEPFFTTKKMGSGTGLGLSTVYGIVKQNRGHVWVYSEKNKGTTFKIYFPAIEENARIEQADNDVEPELTGNETILMAEDDEMLREMAKKMLEKAGYRIITAVSGEDAMDFVKDFNDPIDLLITDIVMPGMNGRDLAGQMQEKIPGLKVLYMSGYTANVIAHHGILDKDLNFIQKPFSHDEIASKIREILDTDQ